MSSRPRVVLAAFALLILAVRLPFLPQSPDDIDAVNFTLGVRDFDIAAHRPHPPGYPILIALGKLASPVFAAAAGAGVPAYQVEARVIAFWSILAAALSVVVLVPLFLAFEPVGDSGSAVATDGQSAPVQAEDGGYGRALGATLLTISAPLFWLTTGRPMSDVPGLVLGAAAMALLATALSRQQALARTADPAALPGADSPIVASGRLIVLGALTAGVAIGLRSQSAWLTVPLLVFVLLNRIGRGVLGAMVGAAMTFTIGVLSWAVPLVIASGGPQSYLYAFSVQAGEDLAGVRMLAFEPDARRLAFALNDTFVQPWHWPVLGWIVTALAATGVLSMLVRDRRGLVALAVAFGPYALFHLLFQDTTFVRYALPLLPAVSYLAIGGIDVIAPRPAPVATGLLVAASLAAAVPLSIAYAREAAPVYRAYAAVAHQGADARTLAVHHNVAQALRGEAMPRPVLPSPLRHEWLDVVRHWRENGAGPIWFLADARRTDLASFDPASQQVIGRYRWSFDHLPLMQGVRPGAIDVVRLDAPGWMAGAGWALTPELAGIARRDGTELGRRPIEALVRRRAEPSVLLIGGRNLGAKGTPDVRFVVTLDGQPLDTIVSPPDPGFFLRFIPLPAGRLSGEGAFATLRVAAESADGSARPIEAGVEQFDVQPATSVLAGFDAGWNEREYNPTTGRLWRWSSASSPLRVHHAGQDVMVTIEGESPLKTFPTAPRITLRAGAEVLEQASPTDDFTITARVPAAVLERTGGTVSLDTTQVFVPSDRDAGAGDHRQLGLRIYRVDVRSAAGVR